MKNPLQYIQQYPDRSKQILGIGFGEGESLAAQAKIAAKEKEQAQEQQKIIINKAGLHHQLMKFAGQYSQWSDLRHLGVMCTDDGGIDSTGQGQSDQIDRPCMQQSITRLLSHDKKRADRFRSTLFCG